MKQKLTEASVKALRPKPTKYEVGDTGIPGFVAVVRPSGAISFCLCYRNFKGQKKRYTIGKLGSITVPQARREALRRSGEVRTGTDIQSEKRGLKAKEVAKRQQTLRVFFDEKYKPDLISRAKTGEKIADYLESHFIEPWGGKHLSELNNWLISGWRKAQAKKGLSNGAVNRPVAALKTLLNKAVEWEVIESNPLSGLKPLKEDKTPIVRFLSDVEEQRLRRALIDRQEGQVEERHRYNEWRRERGMIELPDLEDRNFTDYLMPMVLLALNTGLRRGELFDLRVKDVNFSQGYLSVLGHTSKSMSSRYVPLTKEARGLLDSWIKEEHLKRDDLVFSSPVTGERFDNINKAWGNLVEEARISDFRFHDLRHTFASKLVMRGADLYGVRDLLGHASVETTMRYAHLAPDHTTKLVALLNE